ncbi:MAG: sensor histidine kinase [Halanaeroarchaeum sp.]
MGGAPSGGIGRSTAAGGILTLLGAGLLIGLVIDATRAPPETATQILVLPALVLAGVLIAVGLRTAQGELVEERDAVRLAGWAVAGTIIFLGVGGWLLVLERFSGRTVPRLPTITVTVTTLGAFAGTVVGLYDAGSRARAREIREREAELDERNGRLEDFASIVSHDLRNPLNVAEGRLELAREEVEGANEHLDSVAQSLDRMEALIEDLLVLAREGDAIEDPEPVALDRVTQKAWENVATSDATLECQARQRVVADESRLAELLENLIDNAVSHGGEDVTVRVEDLEDGFAVEDDGPGIPPEERGEVFEAGYSNDPNGTGFGLYIVEIIAEAHGWSVRVTEGSAGGARFEFTGTEIASEQGERERSDWPESSSDVGEGSGAPAEMAP